MNRIIITTDIHGYYPAFDFANNKVNDAGLVAIAADIKDIKDENTILIDNGDFFQGSPLMTNYFKNGGFENPATKMINEMEYDYYNLGNHDFNNGKKNLLNFLDNINAKVLTSNVRGKGIEVEEYIIHTFENGLKVALIGVTTQYAKVWEKKENLEDIIFLDAFDTMKKNIELIKEKEKVDLIIGVYHGGFEKDLITNQPTEQLTGENQGSRMCEELDLDILITGHQHREIFGKLNNVVISQSNAQGNSYCIIEIDGDNITSSVRYPTKNHDKELKRLAKESLDKTNEWLDVDIATIFEGDMLITDQFDARLNKHPLVSFMNEVQLEATNADIASFALANDAFGFRKNISIRDVLVSYPYANTLMVYKVNYNQIKKYLEAAAAFWDQNDQSEIIISDEFLNPKNQMYNYEMVEGIEYTIDLTKEKGNRISSIKFKGKELDKEQILTMSMSNYRANGVGGYEVTQEMEFVNEVQEDFSNLIINYLIEKKQIKISENKNIKFIKINE